MSPSFLPRALLAVATVMVPQVVLAQASEVDLGKAEYASNCASCHGASGRGDGPFKEFLKVPPPDLTKLTKANGGSFPTQWLYQVIDGRRPVRGHGAGDMPIWGADYTAQAAALYGHLSNYDPQAYVRARIGLLVDYVYRLQEK